MITIVYKGMRGGVIKKTKIDCLIFEQPLTKCKFGSTFPPEIETALLPGFKDSD